MSTEVTDYIDGLKAYSVCNVSALQTGFIPSFSNIDWSREFEYTYEEFKVKLKSFTKICIKINGLNFTYKKSRSNNIFHISMKHAIENNIVTPFLLFVNGLFVKWSDISIIHNIDDTYLILDGYDHRLEILNIDILNIPYNVYYNEDGIVENNAVEVFRFNDFGVTDIHGTNIISIKNNNLIFLEDTISTTLSNKILNINEKYSIFKENLILFKNGKLYRNTNIIIDNLNILSISNPDNDIILYKLFYNTQSNQNISNALLPRNIDYTKQAISESIVDKSLLNKEDINHKLDITEYSLDKTYKENSNNGLVEIFDHNSMLMKDLYYSKCKVFTKSFKGEDLIYSVDLTVDDEGYVHIPLLKYNSKDAKVIVFKNGELYQNYNMVYYHGNEVRINPLHMELNDDIDIVFFKDINNTVIDTIIEEDNSYINTEIIDDIILLSDTPSIERDIETDGNFYNVGYSVIGDKISLNNDFYYGKKLKMISESQFRYERIELTIDSTLIKLPDTFKLSLNPDKYIIFVNGRMFNKNGYKVLIPNYNNSYTQQELYSKLLLKAGDIVDIFYIPTGYEYINTAFKVITDVKNVKAIENNQSVFTIPYPYEGYMLTNEGFFITIGSTMVDPVRYELINNNSQVRLLNADDFIKLGESISFVFIYNLLEDIAYENMSNDDFMRFNTTFIEATIEDQSTFTIPQSVNIDNGFIITVGTTFIDPRRYNIVNRDIVFTDSNDYLNIGSTVGITYVNDKNNGSVSIYTKVEIAEEEGQFVFDTPVADLNDNFIVIKNSIVVHPSNYDIINDKLIFLNENEYVQKNNSIMFIYIDTYRDINGIILENKFLKMNTKSTLIVENNQREFNIPEIYPDCSYTKGDFMVSIGSVFIDPRRYEIVDNNIIFDNTVRGLWINRTISFIFIHNQYLDPQIIGGTTERDFINIDTVSVVATEDNQKIFDILYEGIEFFLTIGTTFIDDSRYIIDKESNTIQLLNDSDAIPLGNEILFNFIYSYGKTFFEVEKYQSNIKASYYNQKIFDIPLPFENYLEINNKIILIIGTTYIDPSRYQISSKRRQLILDDHTTIINEGDLITFIFFYIGDGDNSIRLLPENGYVYMNKNNLKYPLYKKLYLLFINGKKIKEDDILDISSNMIRLTVNPQSRYDLVILNHTPEIKELNKLLKTQSKWDNIIDNLYPYEIDSIMNVNTNITDTEDRSLELKPGKY